MDIPELNKKFDNIIKTVGNFDDGKIMVNLGIEASSLIKTRVVEKGIDSNGQKFKAYSTKDMLVGSSSFIQKAAADKLLGSKAKRKKLDWRTVGGSSGYAAMLSVSAGGSGSAGGGAGVRLAILKGGYAELRRLQTRQTDHFDMTFTGKTWADILVKTEGDLLSNHTDHLNGTATIGARNEQYKKILAGNTARRGDILDLSASEIEGLKRRFNVSTLQIFRSNGL